MNLNSLRAQVKKIKSDNAIAPKAGLAAFQASKPPSPKAAEKTTARAPAASAAKKAHYDLNVEVQFRWLRQSHPAFEEMSVRWF